MKRGLIAALLTITLAAIHVSQVDAKVPVIRDFPDVTIGDNPKVTPGVTLGVFVYPDAFDVRDFIINVGENGHEGLDGITSPTKDKIKWSFFELTAGGRDILINGLGSLDADPGDNTRPTLSDIIAPPAGNQFAGGPSNLSGDADDNANIVQGDPGDDRIDPIGNGFGPVDWNPGGTPPDPEDGVTYTATFRDATLSPLPFRIDDVESPSLPADGTVLNTRTITVFASNFSTASSTVFLVFAEFCSDDSISSVTIFKTDELREFDFLGLVETGGTVTVGGVTWFGFGNGGTRAYDSARGLCMTVTLAATGSGVLGWSAQVDAGGLNVFDLINTAVYKVRTFVNISGSATAEDQPLWTVDVRNQNFAVLTYGMASWHFDDVVTVGGANTVGTTEGRTFFDDWWTPLAVVHTTWQVEAFDPSSDDNNNWALFWRVVDADNDALGTANRGGTLCISKTRVECVLFGVLDSGKSDAFVKVMNEGTGPTDPARTYLAGTIVNVGSSLTPTASITGGVATISLPIPTDTVRGNPDGIAGGQITPFDNSRTGPERFFPIERGDNELFMVVASVATSAAGNDPVAIVEIDWLANNLEAGAGAFISSGQNISGGMFRSGSPKPTANRYVFFWYGNNAAVSASVAQRSVGHLVKFFNLGDLGGGLDPVVIDSVGVYVIDGVDIEPLDGG